MDNMNIHPQDSNETVNNNGNQQNTMYQQQVNMGYQGQPNMMYQQPINTGYVDEHKANTLAGVSLACLIGSKVTIIISNIVIMLTLNKESAIDIITNLFSGLAGIASLVGLVIMIMTRVKYPRNRFGKAVMWIYIIIGILELIAVIVATVACIITAAACIESCSNFPG